MSLWVLVLVFILLLVAIPLIFLVAMSIARRSLSKAEQGEQARLEQRMAAATPANATISSARMLQTYAAGQRLVARLSLKVEPPAGEPFMAVVTWDIDQLMQNYLQPGQPISVRIDPEEPRKIYPNVSWARASGVR